MRYRTKSLIPRFMLPRGAALLLQPRATHSAASSGLKSLTHLVPILQFPPAGLVTEVETRHTEQPSPISDLTPVPAPFPLPRCLAGLHEPQPRSPSGLGFHTMSAISSLVLSTPALQTPEVCAPKGRGRPHYFGFFCSVPAFSSPLTRPFRGHDSSFMCTKQ